MKCIYKLTDCLIGHSSEVTSLSISSSVSCEDLKYIVSGSKDGTIIIWKLTIETDTTLYKVLKGHSDVVQKVAITNDQKYVISCSWDCNVCIWEVESGECIKTIKHESKVMDLSYETDRSGQHLISTVQSNGQVMYWKLFSKETEPRFFKSFHNESFLDKRNQLTCCLLGPSTLCTAGSDNKIFNCLNELLYESNFKKKKMERKLPTTFFKHQGGKINDIALSPDYSLLASGCSEGDLYIWSFHEPHLNFLSHFNTDSPINNITFNPSRYWCIAANDNNIIMWNLETKNIFANILIDDLSDINNENKEEIISKLYEEWRYSEEYYKTQLKLRKDQGIQDKPFIRSLSICWLNDQIFYVACDDGIKREYVIREEEITL
ncbi:hypothetical protein ACTA71_002572 [Dictyostelium dimigraforme]